jgi:hypothetical protein
MSWIPCRSSCVFCLACVCPFSVVGFASAADATLPPVKPIGKATSAFRSCQKAFVAARDIKVEAARKERVEAARLLCDAAERMQHSVEHLAWLANIHKALGQLAEAREYWGRVVVETSEDSAPNEKAWRDEARHEMAPFFAKVITTSAARPQTAIDLARLSNPALPEDIACPAIESCAKAALVTGKHIAGHVEVELRLSERGEMRQVFVTILPTTPPSDDEPLSPNFVSCARDKLRNIVAPRERGALQVILKGRFMVMVGESAMNPGQTVWVSGRMREVSP